HHPRERHPREPVAERHARLDLVVPVVTVHNSRERRPAILPHHHASLLCSSARALSRAEAAISLHLLPCASALSATSRQYVGSFSVSGPRRICNTSKSPCAIVSSTIAARARAVRSSPSTHSIAAIASVRRCEMIGQGWSPAAVSLTTNSAQIAAGLGFSPLHQA